MLPPSLGKVAVFRGRKESKSNEEKRQGHPKAAFEGDGNRHGRSGEKPGGQENQGSREGDLEEPPEFIRNRI
jgi:hypothetical protein